MAVTTEQQKRFRAILTGKREELAQVLRRRGGIAIGRSPDATDEIQYASERELAIQNLDRESNILHEV